MRDLTVSDADFFERARTTDFADGWKKEDIVACLKSGAIFGFAEEENGKTVAAITFGQSFESADLEDIYVLPEKRRTGVGFALISFSFSRLSERGIKKIFLEVRESNAPARALYEKAGFKVLSVRKRYYGEENAVVYIKEL